MPANSQMVEKFTWIEKSITQSAPENCKITFKYPQFRVTIARVSDSHIKSINKKIFDMAKEETDQFKSEFYSLLHDGSGWTEGTFTGEYKIHLRNSYLVTLSFYTEKYITPSAHPSHSTLPVNYDFYTTKNLELKNIFKKNSDYLNVLSKLCYDYLMATVKNPDKQLIKNGTKPIAANFKKFSITADSLDIVFDEYTVDCYAGGPHTVPIRYSSIESMIDPKSPVSYYASR